MKEKLWLGLITCGVTVVGVCGVLSYDLFRDAETSLAGVRTTAIVLEVDHTGDEAHHVVKYVWETGTRETTTAWIPDGVRQGAVIDVAVNRRDPDFLIAEGTAAQRFNDYGLLVVMMVIFGLGFLGCRKWLRHDYPEDFRRPDRITLDAPPNRATRRALRRRHR